ncbi:hypothetical protein [Nonomuraea rubra]|uniref:Uncharacterized protein n=1 Tax=Nonomuraea rubra TaxID=46180 RepID=A0A7X0P704_9ACTN|nr:hypothetical protein [Nonomuraea rubra]MBB6556219.1 hypothetical protein [Nonomuraea rubra]
MTPQELYAAVDALRQAKGWPWWKVPVALDISAERIRFMRRGEVSPELRSRAEERLGEAS